MASLLKFMPGACSGCCSSPPPPPPPPPPPIPACTCTAVPATLTLTMADRTPGSCGELGVPFVGDTLDYSSTSPPAVAAIGFPRFSGWFGQTTFFDPSLGNYIYWLKCADCTFNDWDLYFISLGGGVASPGPQGNAYRWVLGVNGSSCSPFLLTGLSQASGPCVATVGGICQATVS